MNFKYFWVSLGIAGAAAGASATMGQQAPAAPPPAPVPIAVPPPAPPTPMPPPVRRGRERPAIPATSPATWVTTSDYPSSALREDRSGTTGFRVVVGTDGRVTSCQITSSSGHADLDAATCSLISIRARFNPALDANGNPTIGSYSTRVRWVIPDDGPAYIPGVDYEALPLAGSLSTTMTVGSDGITSDCAVTQGSGDLATRFAVGPAACELSFYEGGYTDRRGQPISRTVLIHTLVTIAVIPERFVPPTTVQAGQLEDGSTAPAAGRVVRSFIVEVDGTQSFCQVVSATGEAASRNRVGTYSCPNVRFLSPFRDAVGRPERRQVTIAETVSFAGRR